VQLCFALALFTKCQHQAALLLATQVVLPHQQDTAFLRKNLDIAKRHLYQHAHQALISAIFALSVAQAQTKTTSL
jgi:hypothetical protein